MVLPPKLPVRLCALSSLLPPPPPPAERPPPGITSGGSRRLFCAFSCGVCTFPIGVARLSFGGPCLVFVLSVSDGIAAEFSDIGGAAALLTGLWFGEAGIARPSRGTLFAEFPLLAPGIGGRRSGAGDAISTRSGGCWATIGYLCAGGRRRGPADLLTAYG